MKTERENSISTMSCYVRGGGSEAPQGGMEKIIVDEDTCSQRAAEAAESPTRL